MRSFSWAKPPAIVVIGGTHDYLRDREVKNAKLVASKSGLDIIEAYDDAEAVDALTSAGTFGSSCLVVIDAKKADLETVEEIKKTPVKGSCLLLVVPGALSEKKYPAIAPVHGGYRKEHSRPTSRKALKTLAVRFSQAEADRLVGGKGCLPERLAEALVGAAGTDLGVLSFEVQKMSALARSRGEPTINLDMVRSQVRASSDIDMGPLRDALRARSASRVAKELDKIRRRAPDDPLMLMLRAKGGPADLAVSWLQVSIMLRRKASPSEISSRLGIPAWSLERDHLPAAKAWSIPGLRKLVADIAWVDATALRGAPAPWAAFEGALLRACRGTV